MSKYTTGELAKLCGITVRTVQYYDTRNLLVPSELSEGGRRLYSEEDLQRMKIICFLRELDLPINSISQLLSEEHPEKVLDLLLEQQKTLLREEVVEKQARLQKLEQLQKELRHVERFSVETIGDIAYQMEYKKKLRKVRTVLLSAGILLDVIEWGTLLYAIKTGIWWPFLLGMAIVMTGAVWAVNYYYKRVKYICPQCHGVFRPAIRQFFWSPHTPNTRKLICPDCGHKGFCVEVYGGDCT